MTSAKDAGATRIADSYSRGLVLFVTFILWLLSAPFLFLILPGTALSLEHPPVLGIVVYSVLVVSALIWTSYRAWRFGVHFDDDGVTVWNYFRTCRASWAEVSSFADGTTNGRNWALSVLLRDGRTITATATRAQTGSSGNWGSPDILAAARKAAARYEVPTRLTGVGAELLRDKPPRDPAFASGPACPGPTAARTHRRAVACLSYLRHRFHGAGDHGNGGVPHTAGLPARLGHAVRRRGCSRGRDHAHEHGGIGEAG